MALPSIPTVDGNPCTGNACSACCHDTEMLLTDADVERLSRYAGTDEFAREEDGYLLLRTRSGDAVPGQSGRPCFFLAEGGLCRVHDDRPEGCRLYPAIWDVDAEEAVLDEGDCPHTDGFRLPGAVGDAVRRLAMRLERERDGRITANPEQAGRGRTEGRPRPPAKRS